MAALVAFVPKFRASLRASGEAELAFYSDLRQDWLDRAAAAIAEVGGAEKDLDGPSARALADLRAISIAEPPRPAANPDSQLGGRAGEPGGDPSASDDAASEPAAPRSPGGIRVKGFMGQVDRVSGLLWERATGRDEPSADEALSASYVASGGDLRTFSTYLADALQSSLDEGGHRIEDLPQPSRRGYAWLRIAGEGTRIADTIERLRILHAGDPRLQRGNLFVRVGSRTAIWRRRPQRGSGGTVVSLAPAFLEAPAVDLHAALLAALGAGGAEEDAQVKAFARSAIWAGIERRIEDLIRPERAGGVHHDLEASFARVVALRGWAELQRPRLAWSERGSKRRLGTYDFARDLVTINCDLDAAEVPEYVVDCIMHHELLHKRLGVRMQGDRRSVHPPEFRAEEARFPLQEQAEAWLQEFVARI